MPSHVKTTFVPAVGEPFDGYVAGHWPAVWHTRESVDPPADVALRDPDEVPELRFRARTWQRRDVAAGGNSVRIEYHEYIDRWTVEHYLSRLRAEAQRHDKAWVHVSPRLQLTNAGELLAQFARTLHEYAGGDPIRSVRFSGNRAGWLSPVKVIARVRFETAPAYQCAGEFGAPTIERVNTATGHELDALAAHFYGVRREDGEPDADYRERAQHSVQGGMPISHTLSGCRCTYGVNPPLDTSKCELHGPALWRQAAKSASFTEMMFGAAVHKTIENGVREGCSASEIAQAIGRIERAPAPENIVVTHGLEGLSELAKRFTGKAYNSVAEHAAASAEPKIWDATKQRLTSDEWASAVKDELRRREYERAPKVQPDYPDENWPDEGSGR